MLNVRKSNDRRHVSLTSAANFKIVPALATEWVVGWTRPQAPRLKLYCLEGVVAKLWAEALEAGSRPNESFIANGGDSFQAVVLSARLHEELAIDVDYLTILESESLAALTSAVVVDDAHV